jgi:hypothetical protein
MAKPSRQDMARPCDLPEELGFVFERAGFRREELSQWQMELSFS